MKVPFPRFKPSDTRHVQLATLSATCHHEVAEYLDANPPGILVPHHLGRLRKKIRENLAAFFTQIDQIVAELSQQQSGVNRTRAKAGVDQSLLPLE